jgi:hypothetical protein
MPNTNNSIEQPYANIKILQPEDRDFMIKKRVDSKNQNAVSKIFGRKKYLLYKNLKLVCIEPQKLGLLEKKQKGHKKLIFNRKTRKKFCNIILGREKKEI